MGIDIGLGLGCGLGLGFNTGLYFKILDRVGGGARWGGVGSSSPGWASVKMPCMTCTRGNRIQRYCGIAFSIRWHNWVGVRVRFQELCWGWEWGEVGWGRVGWGGVLESRPDKHEDALRELYDLHERSQDTVGLQG